MENKLSYSKPFMAMEQFVPQEFVAQCAGGVPGVVGAVDYAYLDTDFDGKFDDNEQGKISPSTNFAFTFTRSSYSLQGGTLANDVKIGNTTMDGAIYSNLKMYQYNGSMPSSSSMTNDVTRYDNTAKFIYIGTFDVFKRANSSTVYVVGGESASGDGFTNNHS